VEVRCPKQPYCLPATQPLQDGTTPVASSIHDPEPLSTCTADRGVTGLKMPGETTQR